MELNEVTGNLDFGWNLKSSKWPTDDYIIKLLYLYKPNSSLWNLEENAEIDVSDLNMVISLPAE